MHVSRIKTVLSRNTSSFCFGQRHSPKAREEDARLEANERAASKNIRRRCKVTESTARKVAGRSEKFFCTDKMRQSASSCVFVRDSTVQNTAVACLSSHFRLWFVMFAFFLPLQNIISSWCVGKEERTRKNMIPRWRMARRWAIARVNASLSSDSQRANARRRTES